jgi:hypothetical protein
VIAEGIRKWRATIRRWLAQPVERHSPIFWIAEKPHLNLTRRKSLWAGGFDVASKFAIGDKVNQAFSNQAKGTVVAIFTDRADEHRYGIEMFGHRKIQIASESS